MSAEEQVIDEIKKALRAHGAWKLRLRTAITCGKSDFTPQQVKCDNQCEFGKWLYGASLDTTIKAGKPYQVIRRLHAEFHECASKVLALAVDGKVDDANLLMSHEYTERSDKLARGLTKWQNELKRAQNAA